MANQFLVAPAPKRAETLDGYQRNVEIWARQAQQTLQQHGQAQQSLLQDVQALQQAVQSQQSTKQANSQMEPAPTLASATTTGLLSATDWNTFNGKLNGAPNDGNFYGQYNGNWFSPGSVVLVVSFGEGAGGDQNFTIGQSGTQNDGRVYFSALASFQLTDPGGNYTGDSSGSGDTDYYTVPVDGYYQITTTLRLTDGTGGASSPDDVPYGIGIGGAQPGELEIGSHDYPGFGWASIGLAQRNVFQNVRTLQLSQGSHISMVTASPDTGTALYASDGVMTITLIAPTS